MKNYSQETVDFILKNESPENIVEFLIHLGNVNLDSLNMWIGKAFYFLESLTEAFVYLRDQENIEFDLKEFLNSMKLEKSIELSKDDRLPNEIKESIYSYISSLPYYIEPTAENPKPELNEITIEKNDYIVMQFNINLLSKYIKK